MNRMLTTALAVSGLLGLGATAAPAQDLETLRGNVRVDGSSTVFPITEAVAESFSEDAPKVRVTVGVSGTGGGFKSAVLPHIDNFRFS